MTNKLLINCRNESGLTMVKAAEKIGCTKQHLYEMEKGISNNPSAKILNGLISTYGLTHKQALDMYL